MNAYKSLVAAIPLLLAASASHADALFYITEADGQKLFAEAEITSPYFKLATYLESEQVLTFCGPATIAAVLNSMDVQRPVPQQLYPWALFTQDTVFTPENQAVKPYPMVEHEGLVLEQLAQFFVNLGVKAEIHHGDTLDEAGLRALVQKTLSDPQKRLVVNYTRKAIGQKGDGHISPVGAYDADSDRVLVLDVAKYKYPPVWMTIADLGRAINSIDSGSNKTRGLLVVSR